MQSNWNLWAVLFKIRRKNDKYWIAFFKGWLKIQTHLHTENAFTIDKLINQIFVKRAIRFLDLWIIDGIFCRY